MYSDYLVNNRLYLKEDINIECAEYFESKTFSDIHEWVIIKDYIDVFSVTNLNLIIFNHSRKKFIYWCDVSIFLKHHCKTKLEVRDEHLDKILQ
jgi:hypothetical protein